MGRIYCCCICDVPESKYISFPHLDCPTLSKDELSQAARAQAFLGSVRVLNLLTGVTEANSWWTTDRSSHTAYALGQSKLAFIAFMLSRFEMTRTVPRIQVDGLLRGDFAECYVSGQLAHAHCLDILCMALDRLNRKWTYTGIALNFFDRPLVGPAQMPTRAMPTNSNSAGTWEMSDAERLAEYSELGLLSSCPFGIPEPPVLGSSCQEQNAKGGATCDKRQLGSSFLRLPDECLNAVIRYLGEREVASIMQTCRQIRRHAGIWRALFIRTYKWVPSHSRDIDWKLYYMQCLPFKNNFLNRARIEDNCVQAIKACNSWNRTLDEESAHNAAQFLHDISYT